MDLIMPSKNDRIFLAIGDAFKDGLCEWSDIVESVKSAKIPIKNWLVVRGVLQWMINEQMVVRINNIHKEQYQSLKEIKL